jgi:hypothetical protein
MMMMVSRELNQVSQDKKGLPSIIRLPSERWPGGSQRAVTQRATYYILLWLTAEVMIGALLPVIILGISLFDTSAKLPDLSEILSARDLALICVALAAARLPDLMKENTYRLRSLRPIAMMSLILIVTAGTLVATDFEIVRVKPQVKVSELRYSLILFIVTIIVVAAVWGIVAAIESSPSQKPEQQDLNGGVRHGTPPNGRSRPTSSLRLLVGCGIIGYAIIRRITRHHARRAY